MFSTLLAISGLLTSIAVVLAFTLAPTPSVTSQGLSELDSRTGFPVLPAEMDLTAETVSDELKPLVTVIISRKDRDLLQISAPASPGNSGGPLFNSRGQLAGIVISMVDKNQNPNAENLNFAVRADALLDISGWRFSGEGRRHLEDFEQSQHPAPR